MNVKAKIILLTAISATALAVTPFARAASDTSTPIIPESVTGDGIAAGETVFAAPTIADRVGRVLAPVYVNGRGPYRFIVDTGANRSVIAPRVAAKLGLVPDAAKPILLQGVTGSVSVPSIEVHELAAGDTQLRNLRVPIVDAAVFADADGILAVDSFAGMCLDVDFTANAVTITRGSCRRPGPNWARVRGRLLFGQLMVVDAKIGRTLVRAIVDTGSERSLGNPALLQALDLERRADDPRSETQVVGATDHRVEGNVVESPEVRLGEISIGNLAVTFGDLNVFKLWGFVDEPAIVLGMDILGTAAQLRIDYRRVEFAILPQGAPGKPNLNFPPVPTRIG